MAWRPNPLSFQAKLKTLDHCAHIYALRQQYGTKSIPLEKLKIAGIKDGYPEHIVMSWNYNEPKERKPSHALMYDITTLHKSGKFRDSEMEFDAEDEEFEVENEEDLVQENEENSDDE